MEKEFRIGELAGMLGMTNDAIRFYEKEGLLSPSHREANGYRSYTMNDIFRLTDILFFRKLDIPIKDIRRILSEAPLEEVQSMLRGRRERQEQIVEEERLLLEKLRLFETQYASLQSERDRFSLRPMPPLYLYSEDFFAAMRYHEFFNTLVSYAVELELEETPEEAPVVIRKQGFTAAWASLVERFQPEQLPRHSRCLHHPRCAFTVLKLPGEMPIENALPPFLNWIAGQGLRRTGPIVAVFVLTVRDQGREYDYAEVYAPLC